MNRFVDLILIGVLLLTTTACGGWETKEDWNLGIWSDDEESVLAFKSIYERRREIAILRTVGARPGYIFSLLVLEAGLITAAGALLGLTMLYLGLLAAQPLVVAEYGLTLSLGLPSARDLSILSLIALAGVISGTIPAARAYRQSLSDGMVARL